VGVMNVRRIRGSRDARRPVDGGGQKKAIEAHVVAG
jgi:hypothetical protein